MSDYEVIGYEPFKDAKVYQWFYDLREIGGGGVITGYNAKEGPQVRAAGDAAKRYPVPIGTTVKVKIMCPKLDGVFNYDNARMEKGEK